MQGSYMSSGPSIAIPPPVGGNNLVTPTAAAAAAAATAAALTGGGSPDPAPAAGTGKVAAEKVEKVRRYVSVSCGRCNYHMSNWTVRTPARRAPLPGSEQPQESAGAAAGMGGAGAGVGAMTGARAPSPSPTPNSSPASITRCASEPAASVSGEEHLGPLLEPDPSDLFPSHIKTTYLGPEHVLLFPNVDGARHFLGRSVLLDLKHSEEAEKEKKSTNEEFEENGPKGGVSGRGQSPSDRVTLALLCPRCSFMLASSPTSPMLGLKGRFVVYKPSLRLTSTTDVPSPSTEPNSPTQPLGPSDFGALEPTHHDALPLIYDREEFEEILLRSALSPSTAGKVESFRSGLSRRSSYNARRSSDGYPNNQMLNSTTSSDDDTDHADGEDEDNSSNEDDDLYGTANPAELVILTVGQFWCPFSVSAVSRLSDYRRNQGMIMQGKLGGVRPNNGAVGAGSGGGRAPRAASGGQNNKGSGTTGGGRARPGTDLTGLAYRQGISGSSADSSGHSNQETDVHFNNTNASSNANPTSSSLNSAPTSTGASRSKKISGAHSHRRTASVPVTPNLFPANTARKPHHKVTKSSSGIENEDPSSNSARNATLRSPCTFLLLDSFYHGDRSGGIDPSQVLRPDLANDVKELPIPCFLVWYRGCRVNVTNASQHFRCLKGAVIGLDLARYVDIVVPRIAAEARAAFGRCGVTTSSELRAREERRSKLGGGGLGDLGGLSESTKSNEVVWADVEDVPDLDDRPVLDIKL